jgi:hypothetical protein
MSAVGEVEQMELGATLRRGAAARRQAGWPLRTIVMLTEQAAECLARSGRRQMDLMPVDEAGRFRSNASGGGSRAFEAARCCGAKGRTG